MSKIAFFGLGTMGLPMAVNLHAATLDVTGFDVDPRARAAFADAGGAISTTPEEAAAGCDVLITMLPEGRHVREVHGGPAASLAGGAILTDCSTIDVETTRALAAAAHKRGHAMLDAPVSGGAEGARAGTLSFMVGGPEAALARVRPLLDIMGSKVHHMGSAGCGQAAKACHNMICGITALAVCEAFALAQSLDLDPRQFFELCRGAAAQSWILENRCPAPGAAPNAPANDAYKPGFAARLMAKDLRLAQAASQSTGQPTPFGAEAARRFTEFADGSSGELDFSAIFQTIQSPDR